MYRIAACLKSVHMHDIEVHEFARACNPAFETCKLMSQS